MTLDGATRRARISQANQRVKRLLEKAKTQEIFVFSPHDVDVAMHIDFLQSEQKHFAPQIGLI